MRWGGACLIVLLGLSLFLGSCTPAKDDVQMITRIDAATAKGMQYLAGSYDYYQYNDKYLLFVYPGENLQCPLATSCNVTYRLLDAYYDVYFLEEVADVSAIRKQRDDAHAIIETLAKKWESEHIYNTIKSKPEEGGIALDTYCILGFIVKDRKMAEVARSYLDESLDWMPNNYYIGDKWRNIADESWCIRHFIAVRLDKDLEARLIYRMINETNTFIRDDNITDIDKLSVVYHALYVISDYEKAYKDQSFRTDKLRYSDFIGYFTDKKLAGNNLMVANLLDVMVYADYDNPATLESIAKSVLDSQEQDGSWKISADFDPKEGQVFTTFRALIGLNQYKDHVLR